MSILTAPGVFPPEEREKFQHPDLTAKGERRAAVSLGRLETLWLNTGTLCNIECAHCYIESSPTNDRLAYLSADEARAFFDEIKRDGLGTDEIGFTGGEPFMNPDILVMLGQALERGFKTLVLTNAMQPMLRLGIKNGLSDLRARFGDRLAIRVSLDHYTKERHEAERGAGSWDKTLEGMAWLAQEKFHLTVAGRTLWGEADAQTRAGYQALFDREAMAIDARDPAALILFPEMDETVDVPEITTDCWDILHVDPASVMCASSRMVVKRRGADRPAVVACTLLPYDDRFEMGSTLSQARGPVKLNHPHCAKFCVLGGGACSAG